MLGTSSTKSSAGRTPKDAVPSPQSAEDKEGVDEEEGKKKGKKRRRVVVACDTCRRKKVKCEGLPNASNTCDVSLSQTEPSRRHFEAEIPFIPLAPCRTAKISATAAPSQSSPTGAEAATRSSKRKRIPYWRHCGSWLPTWRSSSIEASSLPVA